MPRLDGEQFHSKPPYVASAFPTVLLSDQVERCARSAQIAWPIAFPGEAVRLTAPAGVVRRALGTTCGCPDQV